MSRKKKLSRLISIGIVSAGITASTVVLACQEHASTQTQQFRDTQAQQSGPRRPVWSQEMLQAHNQWRQTVGVPPLTWSDDLAEYAQEWANKLASENFQMYHRPNNPYGENLTWASHQQLTPSQVVDMWGAEVAQYDYASNQCSGVCGHYTQVVWQKTTQVGCAFVRSHPQEIWVCNYNPPGNYRGQKPYQASLNMGELRLSHNKAASILTTIK